MLLVVAPTPRLDRVHYVERLEDPCDFDCAEREVYAAYFEGGGHGLVAMRAARALGLEARLLASRGDGTGEILARCLEDEGLDVAWTRLASPTPMGAVFCGCDKTGAQSRRRWIEHVPVLGDSELRDYVSAFDRELARASAVLFVDVPGSGALGIAILELARRAREKGVPITVVAREASDEILAIGPDFVLEEERSSARPVPELDAHTRGWLWRDEDGQHGLCMRGLELRLEGPNAPDRGGDSPFEAAAVAWQLKEEQHWPTRTAACWALGAATAQRLKELGGRLAISEVDGFFAAVRARELEPAD